MRDRFRSPAHVQELTINVLEEMRVGDVYRPSDDVATVRPGTGFQRVRELVLEAHHPTVPVVDEEGAVVGLVTAEQIRPVMDEHQLDRFVVARDIAAPPYSLQPDDDLYRAHELFRASGCPQIPVVIAQQNDETPAIVGMIDYRELMQAYHRELSRRRDH